MNRLLVITGFILIAFPAFAVDPAPFIVPPGYVAEKIAGVPLLQHPMFACFDDRGRLYVADTAGKNLKAEDLLKEPPGVIRLLEDTDGDGVFDKSTVFADKLTFPMGVLWHQGHVYVCSPPSLWRLTDTNGDGVCDQRTELVTKFGFIGNAADIHGPWLGPDGWLYWTDGRHGHEIKQGDTTMKGKAARIFRCKLDGSNVEVVCGGGMDDPVQLAFTEEGEPFAVVDIFQARPTRVDALIYCIDGGVFPYYEAVLGEFKRTGPLLPAVSELGWVAPSGLIRYRSNHLGKEFTDTLLSTQFNQHKIIRHSLTRVGAGFTSKDQEFITSTNPDFHPTSLVEDADGSLIVIDTGGWFRIGCPTSQVAKPEIKGGLYRVRRVSGPKVEDPRGLKIEWGMASNEKLAELLGDARFVVRDRAVERLAKRGSGAVQDVEEALGDTTSAHKRIGAVWAMARMEHPRARQAIRSAMQNPDASVRQCAVRAAGLYRHLDGRQSLSTLINDENPPVIRELAIAALRVGERFTVSRLLGRLHDRTDRFAEHAIIHAAIHLDDRVVAAVHLKSTSNAPRRAALIALDQMDSGQLTKSEVLAPLLADDRALKETAWDIVLKHPQWLGDVAELVRRQLRRPDLSESERDSLRDSLIKSCGHAAISSVLADALTDPMTSIANRRLVLDVMATARGGHVTDKWQPAMHSILDAGDPSLMSKAIQTAVAIRIAPYEEAILRIANNPAGATSVRLEAMTAIAPLRKTMPDAWFKFILDSWHIEAGANRQLVAKALSESPIDDTQRIAIAELLPSARSVELPRLVDAFRQSTNDRVGRALLAALDKSPALANLKPADLRDVLKSYPAEVRAAAAPLLKRIAVDDAALRRKLAALDGVWKDGNIERGRHVFFTRKSLCSACHAVKGEGERIGPDLSKIGAIRNESDLLEAIVLPSSSIARGFESYTVQMKAGKTHNGVIRRETADAVHLVTPERQELRLRRSEVESMEPSRESVMPQGIDAILSQQELGDLIAFLRSLK